VLLDYLSRGGHLVIATWRSVDTSSVIQVDSLAELLNAAGVEINDCFPLNETIPVKGNWFEGEARFWAERLTIKNPITTVIAKYETSNGWLDRQPAISVSLYKSGLIYYIGTCLDEAPQQQLLDKLLHTASVRPIITHPGIEVQTRINQADGQNIYIIINHELKEQTLWLPWPGYDHIRGLKTQSEITLEPLGVAVVTPIQ
jgi:beta-galactosidase GanA